MGPSSAERRPVLVIGAGPAGLSLARALSMRGLRVDVIERQPRAAIAGPAPDGREIALTRSSMRLLRELGLLDRERQPLPADPPA